MSNNKKVSRIINKFERHYVEIPLEVFGKDPFKTLISTVLSARTKDEVTLEAANRLFAKSPNFKSLRKLSVSQINKLIFPVGFHNTKARHLKQLAKAILGKYGGKIPENFEDLVKLPGVGRKTANLVLNRAFNIPAIAVDTHVHRISNLLKLVKTNTPNETEKALVKVIPKKYWSKINRLFVSVGRQFTSKKRLNEFLKQVNKD